MRLVSLQRFFSVFVCVTVIVIEYVLKLVKNKVLGGEEVVASG